MNIINLQSIVNKLSLFSGIAAAGSGSYSYPESEANGWTDTCVDGEYQSPVDLPTNMKAEVHAPINYRNYFNGHFNKHFKGTLRNTGTSGKKIRIP